MRTTFLIPDKLYKILQIQADKERRTMTALLIFALEKYLLEANNAE